MAGGGFELLREPVLRGTLWFSLMDEGGRWLTPPAASSRFKPRPAWPAAGVTSYRVQGLLLCARKLESGDREAALALFEQARLELRRQLLHQLGKD